MLDALSAREREVTEGLVQDGLRAAAARLAAVSVTPRLDAELLMAHALGKTREAMLLGGLTGEIPAAFHDLVARRLAHEPVAYLTGTRAFWTIELAVGPGVLVPRADSETLIEAAVAHFGTEGPATVLDLGTGPGTLLLAALDQWPGARGLGVDRSAVALAVARGNAERLGMAERAAWVLGDWAGAVDARFDLVLTNPPYIGTDEPLPEEVRGHEPGEALLAGADGLDAYRALAPQLARLIAPGGMAALEIGHTQGAAVEALIGDAAMFTVRRRDLGGRDRCVVVSGCPES